MRITRLIINVFALYFALSWLTISAQDTADPPADPAITVADEATDDALAAPAESISEADADPQPAVVDEVSETVPEQNAPAPEEAATEEAATVVTGAVPQAEQPPSVPLAERGLELQPHPVYPRDQAEEVFALLAEYLADTTQIGIGLVPVRDFHRYWLNSRREVMPDLVLEDAHISAWRMANHGYVPLVRASTPQTYQLLVTDEMADTAINDFAGARICTMPSPSLGYLVLNNWFRDPLRRPMFFSEASSWEECADIVFSGEADGAIMPSHLADLYPNLHTIRESDPIPGLTLSVSPAVDAHLHDLIRSALLVLHEEPEYFDALNEIHVERFVAADPAEYRGLEHMLDRMFSL